MVHKPARNTGLFLVITGAIFWGVGGTVSQKLFQQHAIDVNWLVTTRLLMAGLLLLTVQYFRRGHTPIVKVWKNKKTAIQLITFGVLGMLGVQYTYMASINHGNAAIATLLQYLAPVMIIIYFLLRKRAVLTKQDIRTVSLALIGCFLLLTNGSISQISVAPLAIIWGILSGAALAFYTIYAVPLLKQYSSLVVVGWAMVIGGLALSFIHPPWKINMADITMEMFSYLVFVVIFGTMIAFWFYIESLQSLSPKETSLLSSLEPLSAVFTTVIWLHEPFGIFQWIGTACIIGMALLLAMNKESSSKKRSKQDHTPKAG